MGNGEAICMRCDSWIQDLERYKLKAKQGVEANREERVTHLIDKELGVGNLQSICGTGVVSCRFGY